MAQDSAVVTGEQFGLFLTKNTEHIDDQILKDWYPTDDAWVGHVSTGMFPAESGLQHSWDRFHMAYPDLTGGRTSLLAANGIGGAFSSANDGVFANTSLGCDGTPCNPAEKLIGYGMTRTNYSLKGESHATDLICWDQQMTVDKAKEKWSLFVDALKKISSIINSNWFKVEALAGCGNLQICGASGSTIAITRGTTLTSNDTKIVHGGVLPTSTLTVPYLNSFQEPLQLEGYFQEKFGAVPAFKLITDLMTSNSLREQNPALSNLWAIPTFAAGGDYYKYGVTSGVGNFMIAIDQLPLRFNDDGAGNLVRVFPYENVAASVGVKRQVSIQFLNADYQLDFLWHPMAMTILTLDATSINPEMPFLVRDFAGRWRFAMDNLVVNGAPVDNKRRNKGLWYADFKTATKYERPELVRAILHQRRVNNIVDVPASVAPSTYATQSTAASNTACTLDNVLTFTPVLTGANYLIADGHVYCNGVPIKAVTGAISTPTTIALLVTALTSNYPSLGTWAAASNGTDITLSDTTCTGVTINFS